MQWNEVVENPALANLPFKIELNEYGQIVMTPVKVQHSVLQGKIIGLLYRYLQEGEALAECAIKTSQGTKVADVCWATNERLCIIAEEIECSISPEICIEVLSQSNTAKEMEQKRALYFAAGAIEVWLCDENKKMHFYSTAGVLPHSQLAVEFPKQL